MSMRAGLALLYAALLALPVARAGAGQNYTLRFGPSAGVVGDQANITVLLDVGPGETPVSAWSMGVCHGAEVDIASVADGGTTASIGPDFQDVRLYPGAGWTVGVVLSFFGTDTIPPGSGYAIHVPRYELLAEGTAVLQFCDALGAPPVATVVTIADASSTTFPPIQIDGAIEIGLIPPFLASFAPASAGAGEAVTLVLSVDNPISFDGFAFGVTQPAGLLSFDAIAPGAAILAAAGGAGPAFFAANLAPAGGAGSGATAACLLSLAPPFAQVPAGDAREIAVMDATIAPTASEGALLAVELVDTLGAPPVLTRFTIAGTSVAPLVEPGQVAVTTGGTGGAEFVRGDVNGDGAIAIADAVVLASYLFAGSAAPGCLDASDVNDNGGLLIDDVIVLLSYQFGGGGPPGPPFPGCGTDPSADPIDCAVSPVCP